MLVFGTEMHLVTFVFIILEIPILFYQFTYSLSRPKDKSGYWYMILLFLLIIYNITGGLFPDADIPIPIVTQNVIAYGSGFLMASYFPYYFYKGLGLHQIRFHALYGVPLFLLLPYLIFFVIGYVLDEDLDFAISHGVIIPFLYSFIVLWAILKAIRLKYIKDRGAQNYMEMTAVYCAVVPWACMPVLAYLHVDQVTEVMFSNSGFIIISIVFISKSVARARRESELLMQMKPERFDAKAIEDRCKRHGLTSKESEIVRLICQQLKYREIAEKLFISPRTVDKHAENIFNKVDVNTRAELIHKMTDFLPSLVAVIALGG